MKLNNIIEEDYFSRSNLINYLIGLYGYKSYLEIGVNNGENFEKIECSYKVGVDPSNNYDKVTFNITSDDFFAQNKDTFDIIFVDGSHISDQAIIDIKSSLEVLNPKGTIVMHDCLPPHEGAQLQEQTQDHWNGDVWKAFAYFRAYSDLTMFTIFTDHGLGIIKKGNQVPYKLPSTLDWEYLSKNGRELMNIQQSVSNALKLINSLHESGL